MNKQSKYIRTYINQYSTKSSTFYLDVVCFEQLYFFPVIKFIVSGKGQVDI